MKRSSAYAREGEFRAADDAQTEAMALGRMATGLETEAASLRTQSHATMKRPPRYAIRAKLKTVTKTIQSDIGNGLKDGIGTAGTAWRLKQLREKGATDIELARTGRLRFTRNGQRYEYRVIAPRDRVIVARPTPSRPPARPIRRSHARLPTLLAA
jgi:hypothetical protein